MVDVFLVSEITVEANGESAPVELGSAQGKSVLLTLAITKIIEQESLDVSVWGSEDGQTWSEKVLAAFPQKFYKGIHQLLLDLSGQPGVRFLKTKWELNRWGRGDPKPRFSFMLKLQEQNIGTTASPVRTPA